MQIGIVNFQSCSLASAQFPKKTYAAQTVREREKTLGSFGNYSAVLLLSIVLCHFYCMTQQTLYIHLWIIMIYIQEITYE